jgi:tryptophan synthase alpha chain
MSFPIAQAFRKAKQAGRCAFIPYLTGGFPSRTAAVELLKAVARSGAELVEIGVPFSDPLADGPTIQEASRKALDQGVKVEDVLSMVAEASSCIDAPIVLMTYWNPVLQRGPERFARQARAAGAAGVIVPDLPMEEADDWMHAASAHELDTVLMAAPTTSTARLERLLSKSRGFLYYVSMTGVTGAALALSEAVLARIDAIRRIAPLPVAVGFGVATPDQARQLAGVADGVIVGSALIRLISDHPVSSQVDAVEAFVGSMREALVRS